MKKLWITAPAVIAAPLVLALCISVASTPSPGVVLSHDAAYTPKFAAPAKVTVLSVTPTAATVRFVLRAADGAAASEQVVVYPAGNQAAKTAFSATVARSSVTITGLKPTTLYFAEVSVNAVRGRGASAWTTSSGFTTGTESVTPPSDYSSAAATATASATPTPTPTLTPTAAASTPAPTPTLTPTAAASTPAPTPTGTSTPAFTPISWPTTFNPVNWPTTSAPIPYPAPSTAAPTPTPASVTVTPAPWPTSAAATATASPTPPDATTSTAGSTATASATDTASASASPSPTFSSFPTSSSSPSLSSSPSSSSPPSPPSSAGTVPFAPALSSYSTLAQSYSATDIVNGGWAQDANDTNEGGGTCPVANTTYSSALNAVVLTTDGLPATGQNPGCAHIRSQFTVPTSGDVVEAEIWVPSLSSAATMNGTTYPAGTLLDWTSMWTDGAGSTNGTENWPADTEVDAVETQYGTNYISIHYGSVSSTGGSTGAWTTEPQGWQRAGAGYGTANAGVPNLKPGWNVVDIEFTSTDANIYYNGQLFTTVPGSVLTHDPAYLNFGISGPNGYDPNYPLWPAGSATEDVRYVKVFS